MAMATSPFMLPSIMTSVPKNSVLAVILARGGSKGIPGKNLRTVGGITLVGRAIEAAKQAQCVTTILVSTDDSAIRAEAQAREACVIARPQELAGDKVSSEAALLQAMEAWHEQTGKTYQAVALLQATSPFTRPADIDRIMEPILSGDADATLTVIDDFGYFWFEGEDGWKMPYQARATRQQRMPWKREAGNVYGIRYDLFLRSGQLFPGRVLAVTIPANSFLEIDEPRELLIAEALEAAHEGRLQE
jgi:N-acylneuraminate cytidylyltransferase